MLNLIRQLANELRIPIVCLGTREGREALLSDPQLARRFEGFELPRWQRGEEFHGLLNTLLRTLPLQKPVSYTHLDVYKRQNLIRGVFRTCWWATCASQLTASVRCSTCSVMRC